MDQDVKSTLTINLINHTVPNPPTNTPYVPSEIEQKYYLYGLPSKPRFLARSSSDIWMKPVGPEAYFSPKELAPLGVHSLNKVWEDTIAPAFDTYLLEKEVCCTILHPLRIGIANQPLPFSPVILVGVDRDTLPLPLAMEVAMHCRSILLQHEIDDIHIIVYESEYTRTAMLYKPAISANPAAIFREPFSTSLGIPICNAETTNIEGTAGFFFTDSAKPGVLYLLTARHVLFNPEEEQNALYTFREGGDAVEKKVMLMGEATFKNRCKMIESAIKGKEIIIEQLQSRLAIALEMEDEDDAEAEQTAVEHQMKEVKNSIIAFEKLLKDIAIKWEEEKDRVIGHVTLSPPISLNHGNDGFTEDWAVIQIDPSMIARLNFIGNAIDLGSVKVDKLTEWMYPHPSNPSSFKYPGDQLLRFSGIVSDQEMFQPDLGNIDKEHNDDSAIIVLKNGSTSNLTVGRLNTIRAFVREYSKDKPSKMSREISVLSRNSQSGPFSERGDSGAAVIDGRGRVCGVITGGDGATDVSDCTFVTSINFLIKRLNDFGIKANIFPSPVDL